jgi:DUF1365 family protein
MSGVAFCAGEVAHARHTPSSHSFQYPMGSLFIDLDLTPEAINLQLKEFPWPVSFRREDYIGPTQQGLKQSVLSKASAIHGSDISGKVYFIGQPSYHHLYFSPVNFYIISPGAFEKGQWLLAEVSNTPWNERHYYLVNCTAPKANQKNFHVSPFNPMNLHYHWQIDLSKDRFRIGIQCCKANAKWSANTVLPKNYVFSAETRGRFVPATDIGLLDQPRKYLMGWKVVRAIYWQALKIWLKKNPYYPHPLAKER